MMTHEPGESAFMRRAIELAKRGRGMVEPNPLVGCVLEREGQISGEGFHANFGGPHAEPSAIADCLARGQSPAGATAYATLEPCCHTDKKTAPCVPALIAAGIARVVVGCLDPNSAVNGRGVAMLKTAGVRTDGPLLEPACKQLIAPFIARVVHGRPYVTLKWAQSADGKVAGPGGRRLQISNEHSMRAVHELRSRCDAIMVGMGTVIADDPLLTPRGVEGGRVPMRVVMAGARPLPPDSRLARGEGAGPVRVFQNEPLAEVLRQLSADGVTHLLVEGGPTLHRSFIEANLADRAWVFDCPIKVGDPSAPGAATITPSPGTPGEGRREGPGTKDLPPSAASTAWTPTVQRQLGGDLLSEYLNPASPLFFAPEQSADLALVNPTT